MRLIDADALKYKNLAEVNGRLTHVLTPEEINNAPTVIDHSLDIAQKSIELGRSLGRTEERAESKRPQGEWEDYSVDFWKCPECGYLINKFCPQCYNKVILPNNEKGRGEP